MTTPTMAGQDSGAPPRVHPKAIVHPGSELSEGIEIGPYSIIGPGVMIGANTVIGPHAYVEKDTRIGRDCYVANGAVLGTDPQDRKYEGEQTLLIVGDGTTIREFATLNRGTRSSGSTIVGSGCLVMAYSHISHDSRIGDHVVIANSVQMGGHVVIEDWATVGGLTAIHQFVRIGTHAFIGGASRLPKDVPPYTLAVGNPCRLHGLNSVGLARRGFSRETRGQLKQAYRVLFNSHLNIGQAIGELRARGDLAGTEEVERLISFIESSERGITV
ncbi:MAG: acyl-ACP--UDP-N-acetylglucosamine O-acyltransferase [Gemmatimonadales bacterium]